MRRWLLSLVLSFAGCAAENQLSGSAGELIGLAISRTEIHRNQEALQITYFHNRGTHLDVVARLAVSLQDVELQVGRKLDLSGEYAPAHPRATVTHAPGGEPVRTFPPVRRGDLFLEAGGPPDEPMRGNFSLLFDEQGGDFGGGRTLEGTFSGMVRDAGFD